jgi:hypothetical protein
MGPPARFPLLLGERAFFTWGRLLYFDETYLSGNTGFF